MSTHTLNVAPTIDESGEDSVVLAKLREIVMATSGVQRIYPPATVPSKMVRAVGVVASTVRDAVENILPDSDDDAETVVHTAEGDSQVEVQDVSEEKPLPDSDTRPTSVNVRIGASAGANITETARAVAQSIRAVQGENVAVTVDVVHI